MNLYGERSLEERMVSIKLAVDVLCCESITSSCGVGDTRSIELYEDDELSLHRSALMRRCGVTRWRSRPVDIIIDWMSSQMRLKRRNGPATTKTRIS